jgi:predicted amidohydrolase
MRELVVAGISPTCSTCCAAGDILTHAYSGAGNNTAQNGKLLEAALRAK